MQRINPFLLPVSLLKIQDAEKRVLASTQQLLIILSNNFHSWDRPRLLISSNASSWYILLRCRKLIEKFKTPLMMDKNADSTFFDQFSTKIFLKKF
jgi:hypothetical protein